MQVVVYSTILKDKDKIYVQELFDILHEENINAYVYEPYLKQLQGKINFQRDVAVSYTHLPSPRDATLSRMPSSA